MVQICPGDLADLLHPSQSSRPPPAHRAKFFSQSKFQQCLSWLPFPLCESVNAETAFAFFLVEQNCHRRKEFWPCATGRSPPANSFARASVPLGLLSFSPLAIGADPSPSAPLTRELKAAIDGVLYSSGRPSGDLLGPYKLCPELHHSPRTHFRPQILLSEPQASPHCAPPATANPHCHQPKSIVVPPILTAGKDPMALLFLSRCSTVDPVLWNGLRTEHRRTPGQPWWLVHHGPRLMWSTACGLSPQPFPHKNNSEFWKIQTVLQIAP
jgi:hypothetical protein